jgi:hypothetical protein
MNDEIIFHIEQSSIKPRAFRRKNALLPQLPAGSGLQIYIKNTLATYKVNTLHALNVCIALQHKWNADSHKHTHTLNFLLPLSTHCVCLYNIFIDLSVTHLKVQRLPLKQ